MSWLSDLFGTSGISDSAKTMQNQLLTNSGALTSAGQGTFAAINPTLNREAMGGAPGYGPLGLANMMNQTNVATSAKSGAMAEDAKLRALRTGNPAAVNASNIAATQAGTMAAGSTLRDILSANENLKNQQQQFALGQLGKEGAAELGAGVDWGRIGPDSTRAALSAQNQPFENLMQWMQAGSNMAKSFAGAGG